MNCSSYDSLFNYTGCADYALTYNALGVVVPLVIIAVCLLVLLGVEEDKK